MSVKVEVGSIVEGKIIKIKPFGAIVALPGNVQGLVHISQISNSYIQNISDHLAVSDVVKVKVLSIEASSGKIALSIKEASQQTKAEPKPRFDDDARPPRQSSAQDSGFSFEDKFKEWVKSSNERQAGINKRNKRR